MKLAFISGLGSGLVSTLLSAAYFVLSSLWMGYGTDLKGTLWGFIIASIFAAPLAGFLGFIFGFIGSSFMDKKLKMKSPMNFTALALLTGGVMGAIAGLIEKLLFIRGASQSGVVDPIIIGFMPCITIGALTALIWAFLYLRLSKPQP